MGDPERPDRLRPLPRRLQHQRDDPRGQGQADPLAQPPRGRRGLALRQGPLRLRAPARRRPDHRSAAAPGGRAASSRSTWDGGARRGRAAAPRRRRGDRHRALGLRDRRAGLRARASSCASASARTQRVLPEEVPDALDAFRAPLSAIRDADGRRRPLRRAGRSSARRSSTSGSRPRGATAPAILTELPDDADRGRRPDHRRRARAPPGSRRDLGAAAAFYLPRTPNGRGVTDAWSCAADGEPADGEPTLARSSPATRPRSIRRVRALAEQADAVIGIGMFEDSFRGVCRPRPAGHELPRARRHDRQPRGPPAAPAPRRDRALPRRARLDREARRALRASSSRRTPRSSSRRSRRPATAASPSARSASRRRSRRRAEGAAGGRRRRPAKPLAAGSGLRLLTYRPLFSGPAVERTPELAVPAAAPARSSSRRADARARRIADGDDGDGRARTAPPAACARGSPATCRRAASGSPRGRRRRPARPRRGDAE